MTQLPVDAITVGERRRDDYGDVAGLAASIKKYGLLHPVVVDDEATLIAGGRRLQAVRSLGWEMVDVRSLGELTDAERDEIELEENLQRKDLTAYERAKTVASLAETARQVLTQTCSESEQVSKPTRGPSRTAGSLRDVAARIGHSPSQIVEAQQHVETAEAYPELQGPGWKQYHVLEAREKLEKLPEPERPKAVALVSRPGIDPRSATEMIGNLATKPAEVRERIYEKAESADPREQSDAITEAWNRPAMPDPRLPMALDIVQALKKAMRAVPEDAMTAAGRALLFGAEEWVAALKEYRRES